MNASSALLLYSHPETGELLRRRWVLHVLDGTDHGVRAEVMQSPALVGAAPAATLVLTDDTVSRYHAELDVFADGLRLRDLDSTNGTFVGDRRVREAYLEDRDVFRVGRTDVRVVAEDEPAASEIDTDPRGVPPGAVETLGGAIAVSGVTRELLRLVRKIAPSSSAVLFEGELGTGKATLARLLHDLSPRRELPFVSISPRAAGDADEVEARLFGRPARPGGAPARPGLFELARGGTLFIEGVEHLPASLQAPLLHTLESGELPRTGDDRRVRAPVRLVCSSEKKLADELGFDPALYRRVAVVRLTVPPLRARPEDVAALAEYFLTQLAGRPRVLGPCTLGVLRPLAFPGNLDQLRRLIATLGPESERGSPFGEVRAAELGSVAADLRAAYVTDVVAARRGDVTTAAGELGMAQKELFRFLSRHAVDLDGM